MYKYRVQVRLTQETGSNLKFLILKTMVLELCVRTLGLLSGTAEKYLPMHGWELEKVPFYLSVPQDWHDSVMESKSTCTAWHKDTPDC